MSTIYKFPLCWAKLLLCSPFGKRAVCHCDRKNTPGGVAFLKMTDTAAPPWRGQGKKKKGGGRRGGSMDGSVDYLIKPHFESGYGPQIQLPFTVTESTDLHVWEGLKERRGRVVEFSEVKLEPCCLCTGYTSSDKQVANIQGRHEEKEEEAHSQEGRKMQL